MFFSTLFAHAQTTGTISGKVTDTSGKALNGVNISLIHPEGDAFPKESFRIGTGKGAATNANGNFRIENVSPGSYTLRITAVGYVEQELAVKVASGQTLSLPTIVLKIKSQRLDAVEVTGEGSLVPTKETEYVARMPLANIENPQVYNVVSSKLLEKQGVVNLDAALTNVAGISMNSRFTNFGSTFTGRGFIVRSTLRNGVNLASSNTDIANIERVEVIKGPAGTLFGAVNSYGALVNRITKKPHDKFEGSVGYTTGSWGFNRLTADVNTPLAKDNRVLLRNNVALQTTGTWQDAGGGNMLFYAPSLVYKANDRLTLSLDADIYQSKNTPVPFNIGDINPIPGVRRYSDFKNRDPKVSFSSNELPGNNFNTILFAKGEYQLADNWKSTTLVSYNKRNMASTFPYNIMATRDSIDVQFLKRSFITFYQQIQQNFNGEFGLLGMRHRVLLGLDYLSFNQNRNEIRLTKYKRLPLGAAGLAITRQQAETLFADKKPFNTIVKNQTYSAYISDVVDFTDRLHLLLSLRLDRFDNGGSHNVGTGKTTGVYQQTALAPRLGVVYELLPRELSLFANYNSGFRNLPGADAQDKPFIP